jgi:tetratricopeptide (TPR) repeat protein
MGHLRKRDLEALLGARPGPTGRRRAVRHLIAGCAECGSRVCGSASAEEDAVYDACLDRARETARAWGDLWREEREKRERGLALVRAKGWAKLTRQERLSLAEGWAGVEILLEVSFEARYRDPGKMLRLAREARAAAERLDTAVYGERQVADLQARVLAEVANALRVNERFDSARETLKKARALLERGTADPMIHARIDDVDGSLWKDERYLTDAEDLFASACRRYLRLGERHLAARILVNRGICRFVAGRPLEAARLLRKAVPLLDAERDPQLIDTAQHNLLFALADAGEFREAGELLLQSGLRRKFADDPLNLLRLRWVEAKILAGRGRLEDAEKALRDVRASFRIRRLELVATVAGLDLGKVLLQQGRLDVLYLLVVELRAVADAFRLPKAVSDALATLEVVCQYRKVTVPMVEKVRAFVQRLEHDPDFTWTPELMLVG